MRIGVDIMGGDYAPEAIVLGAALAQQVLPPHVKLILIGDKNQAIRVFEANNISPDLFEYQHTTQVIEMGDHPSKAYTQKPDSSIVVGFGLLNAGGIDGFASAGNTGAMMVGAMLTIRSIPGIIRPGIPTMVPQINNKLGIMIDVGLNPDCKPDVLYQYAILGSIYAEKIFGIQNPRVGLLNIGTEKEKGNLLTKATNEAMQGTTDFNFIGNVEGGDIFDSEKVDVIVCDGFVGNIILKTLEGFFLVLKKKDIHDEFVDRFNFENIGGVPVLGINKPVIIGHGVSNSSAIKSMITQTYDVINAGLTQKFTQIFK